MIYIELNGRIGNHMFQIAAAATLAKKNNCEFAVFCHDKYLLAKPDNCSIYEYIQQFKESIFKDIPILTKIPNNCIRFKQEGSLYKPINYYHNLYLFGTFQSEKYFDSEIVKHQFQIPSNLKERLNQSYGHILNKGVTSINVRRGDYLTRPDEYNITSMDFFKKAINYIGKDTDFLIISDDIKWCKKNFKGANYFFADNNTPLMDLYLQSLCTNNIISNSTFSWWGAWLNENPDKIVIAPKPWYGKALSNILTDDLIPKSWVQIENHMPLIMKFKAIKIIKNREVKSRIKKFIRPVYFKLKKFITLF